MAIPAIGAISAAIPTQSSLAVTQPSGASAEGFGASLAGAIEGLQGLQATSNDLAIKAVTGDLQDIHDATIASTKAQVTLELVAAVRNKGVEAFNEIMRMQA